ncbi:hypothetical protein LIA77_01708 [Sarocladium implicatum]|nr:hypothetical protein LIA77_01708 [Sarocladium implicatum]
MAVGSAIRIAQGLGMHVDDMLTSAKHPDTMIGILTHLTSPYLTLPSRTLVRESLSSHGPAHGQEPRHCRPSRGPLLIGLLVACRMAFQVTLCANPGEEILGVAPPPPPGTPPCTRSTKIFSFSLVRLLLLLCLVLLLLPLLLLLSLAAFPFSSYSLFLAPPAQRPGHLGFSRPGRLQHRYQRLSRITQAHLHMQSAAILISSTTLSIPALRDRMCRLTS